ncbi:MAG: cell envelope biogenesis protein TolA [Hyphomicrobiales bacterium]|nr:MAG: cell envelope biogenesis protein TolA [Hyphomicrobiales bacterium]
MSKVLAVMIAGLFAAGAYAQNPAGKAPEQGAVSSGKAVERAEMKKDAKPAGMVKAPGGDQAKVAEGSGGVTASKAVDAGAARAATRDERRRNKDGSVKRKSTQGGTPQ